MNSMGFAKPPSKSTYTICNDFAKEEDFQTVAIDDDHWITDPVPDRCLCIHEHSQPHSLCSYPCPYMNSTPASYKDTDTLDLSDISDFEDVMTTSSDKDIPALDDVSGLWNQQTMVSIKTFKLAHLWYLYHYTHLLYLIGICIHIGYLYGYTFIYDMSFVFNATAVK